ncbi:MAG: DoxX family protein [Chloroflexi bacterium]|nr:DoxX family protein [Chloroflexota bacterium]
MLGRFFKRELVSLQDPPFAQKLFGNTEWAWLWLIARVYIGFSWLEAGWHKLGDPKWMETGEALQGFWARAVAIPETGRPAIYYDWYRSFLNILLEGGHYTWFAKLVSVGELLVGIALIVGAFTAIAALFGALMNFNFLLAGTASSNPLMLAIAVVLILAWKTAGYWGVDRWLLPALGTPWSPGLVFRQRNGVSPSGEPSPPPAAGGRLPWAKRRTP